MIVEVYFRITFSGITKMEMVSKLRNIELSIPYSIVDIDEKDSDPNTIECIAIVPKKDDLRSAAARMDALYLIKGVRRISIDHVRDKKERRDIFRKPIWPIFISVVLNFLNVYAILVSLNVKFNTNNDYLTVFVLPTISTLLLGILYKYY